MPKATIITPSKEQYGKVTRVAPYCRVSTNSADQLNSYATQIRVYKQMICQKNGWQLVEVFADEGISGTSAEKRPEFLRMIKACELHQIDLIITKSISRFARNTKEALQYVRKLKLLGVGVLFEKESINTMTLGDEMLLNTFAAMAQEESVAISQHLRNANTKRMSDGDFIDGNAPYGYRMVNKQLIPYEAEATVVRDIFAKYLNGMSAHEITRVLNEKGVPSKQGGVWTYSVVRYILKNEKYMGDTLFQKSYHTNVLPFVQKRNYGAEDQYYAENTHEGIISKDDFHRVQTLLDTRRKKETVGTPIKKYMFTGKMHCTCCGAFFTRKKAKGGLILWVCSRHLEDKDTCPSFYYREERIKQAFLTMVNKLRFGGSGVIEQAELNMNDALTLLKRGNMEARQVSQSIAELNEKLLMIEQLRIKGYIDNDVYQKQSKEARLELTRLREKRQTLFDSKIEVVLSELRQLKELLNEIADPMETFDIALFDHIVTDTAINNQDEITFTLIGGLEFTEQL